MIEQGQRSFRSQLAYVNLVAVLILSAVIIVVWDSQVAAAVFAGLGAIWTALTLRSGIDLTTDGLKVRGILTTRELSWAETDSFVVVGFAGVGRRVLTAAVDHAAPSAGAPQLPEIAIDALEGELLGPRVPMFSVVAVVTNQGRRLRVHGTAATPLDPAFPAQAAAELNRALRQHNPAAGEATVADAATDLSTAVAAATA